MISSFTPVRKNGAESSYNRLARNSAHLETSPVPGYDAPHMRASQNTMDEFMHDPEGTGNRLRQEGRPLISPLVSALLPPSSAMRRAGKRSNVHQLHTDNVEAQNRGEQLTIPSVSTTSRQPVREKNSPTRGRVYSAETTTYPIAGFSYPGERQPISGSVSSFLSDSSSRLGQRPTEKLPTIFVSRADERDRDLARYEEERPILRHVRSWSANSQSLQENSSRTLIGAFKTIHHNLSSGGLQALANNHHCTEGQCHHHPRLQGLSHEPFRG